ncbi:hypothetical protein TSUD_184600 [Trifolium subterraneum]|uniref:DUF7963 domain-containing protein n=1 Tax=Trifolium subterraneum TaxID=3900 RepID=A0A2Z6PBM4_TRISU|nr:hypothetical protein TSUD_184600 [Trifolium subterraneum]
MAATTNTTASIIDTNSSEEATAKAIQKRYEGLVTVRNKAIKGKGAWYWSHLEPLLVHNNETGLPKAVKLRCFLCDAVFSASNPSRTASEHLKRGTCPNFNSAAKPISSVSPETGAVPGAGAVVVVSSPPPFSSSSVHRRKRSSPPQQQSLQQYGVDRLQMVSVSNLLPQQPHLMLSGGKDDLGALAMLEDSVKKLKSPKTSPGIVLHKTQVDSAVDFLADWVYESCGSVSFSSLEHPKFRAFLTQVGLPPVFPREFVGSRLDAKFEEVKSESEARIRDAMFFQIGSDGWKTKDYENDQSLVNLTVNLPNGTSLYRKAVFVNGSVPSNYAEDVLWETISGICGNLAQNCVGIVADKFKSKALKNLEIQNHWMVNLSCQYQAFNSLIKDFTKELPLFRTVTENCIKVANFVNYTSPIRNSFHKYQLQEYGHTWLLRVLPMREFEDFNFEPVYAMIEDTLSSVRALQLVLLDESFKMVCMEDRNAREVGDMIRAVGFWNDLEAVHSLVKLVKNMAKEIESEKPLVGQCLLLWNELRTKVKDWCSKFNIAEGAIEKLIERRFRKNYHPAWAAAYILDPLYLIRDTSGKYLPPFKHLTPEQEKDVDRLITRLVSRDEAHIVLMELMKWRTEGLDPVYAQAVQMKERDPITGKMRIVNPQSSRLVWETYLTEFKSLGRVAVRLIFLHATSCGFKCSWSLWKWVCSHGHYKTSLDKVQKLIFVAAHSKLERRDFSSDEDKDAELFTLVANGEDDVLNEVLVDSSSV